MLDFLKDFMLIFENILRFFERFHILLRDFMLIFDWILCFLERFNVGDVSINH